ERAGVECGIPQRPAAAPRGTPEQLDIGAGRNGAWFAIMVVGRGLRQGAHDGPVGGGRIEPLLDAIGDRPARLAGRTARVVPSPEQPKSLAGAGRMEQDIKVAFDARILAGIERKIDSVAVVQRLGSIVTLVPDTPTGGGLLAPEQPQASGVIHDR